MKHLTYFVVGVMSLAACAPTEPGPYPRLGIRVVNGEPDLDVLEIVLARSPCMGACPVYTLRIQGNGTVTYNGIANVQALGTRTASMDRAVLRSLLDRFEKAAFPELEHECKWKVFDAPTAELTLRVNGSSHTFHDPTGGTCFMECDDHARVHLAGIELAGAVDKACRVEQWVGSD